MLCPFTLMNEGTRSEARRTSILKDWIAKQIREVRDKLNCSLCLTCVSNKEPVVGLFTFDFLCVYLCGENILLLCHQCKLQTLIDVSLPWACEMGQAQVVSSTNAGLKASAPRKLLKRVFDTQVCEKAHVTFLRFSDETSEWVADFSFSICRAVCVNLH